MNKILLVEDNKTAADKIQKFIRNIDLQYEVIVSAKAADAYAYACKEHIALFILDIQLADYKGTNLARQLRELPAYRYTPIIFETAVASEELNAYRDVNCYGYLIKPFSEDEFGGVFRKAIGLSSSLSHTSKTIRVDQKQFIFEYDVSDIVYMESFGKKVVIHTYNPRLGVKQDTISGYSLMKLLEMVGDDFIQCHKSYIVNRKHIEQINKSDRVIVMKKCEARIPVGNKFQPAVWG